MRVALVFRKFCHWTVGYALERAMTHHNIKYDWFDPNDLVNFQGHENFTVRKIGDWYDCTIVMDDGFGLQKELLETVKRPVVFWGSDFHNGLQFYSPDFLEACQKIYACEKTTGLENLRNAGFNNVEWLPHAYDEFGMWYERGQDRIIPCSFVGSVSGNPERLQLIDVINSLGGRAVTGIFRRELADVYARSKIGIHLGQTLTGVTSTRGPQGIGMRPFEVMGCGSMLLMGGLPMNDFKDLFIVDREYSEFSDVGDLFDRIRYFLGKPIIMKNISDYGYNKIMLEHTFSSRLKVIGRELGF